jgi:phosphatidate cytidylyltransferase
VPEDEGQERRSEDLFEDLDKFFAPIQDVDWPAEGEAKPPTGSEPAPGGAERPAPAEPANVFDDDFDSSIAWDEPPASESQEPEATPHLEQPAAPPLGAADAGFGSAGEDETLPAGAQEPGPATSSSSLAEDMFGKDTGPQTPVAAQPPAASGDDLFGSGSTSHDDDLLPAGWASGLDEGIDLDVDVPPAAPEAAAPDAPATAGERFLGEPTAEMSGDDWAELQMGPREEAPIPGETTSEPYSYMERFLPDEEEMGVPEFGYGPDPGEGATPSGGTTGIDWDEPVAAGAGPTPSGGTADIDWGEPQPPGAGPASLDDSGPISIDDLRKAPDEYRDLPGPVPEEVAGVAAASAAVHGSGEDPGAPGDLDAAAEHFAESIRQEEPSLGLDHGPADDPFADQAAVSGGPAEGEDLFGAPVHREPYSEHPEPLVFPGEGEDEQDDLLSFGEPEGPRTVKVGAAEDAGPSWQEPTSVEVPVEGEQEPPRPSRNLSAAIVTGVVLAVVALIALWAGKVFFAIVAGAVVLLAQLELYTAIRKRGYQPAVPLGLIVGGLICAGGYWRGEGGILAMTLVGALFTPLWYMATPARQRRNVVANMGVTLFGIMAVPFLGGFALAIIHDASRAFTIMVLALAFGFDIVAYAIGTLTGSKPLAPSISPNKTREGVYGGFLVLAVLGFVALGNIDPLTSVWQGLIVGIAAAAAATLGDLAESLAKRDLGVKDMGTIFPGHGGALDRIDSVLFVAPVVYYVVKLLLS